MSADRINLFWTGGFDSSFRLLEILLVEGKPVQTYYIIDTGRPSSLAEIRAMEAIKKTLLEKNPQLRSLLRPIQLELLSNLRPNPELTEKYDHLAAQVRVGIQYEWLARFAEERQLFDIELCMTKLPSEGMTGLHELLHQELIGQGHDCQIRESLQNEDLSIFRYYRFPTIHVSKVEMEALSLRRGFDDLLKLTWYCHSPTPDGRPCGQCRPCQIRSRSGLEHAAPKKTLGKRALNRLRRLVL